MLGALSVVAAWLLLYAFVFSGFQEASAQRTAYANFRSELAQAIAPVGKNIPLGAPVAELKVPQAGIDDVVLEGTTSGVLESGPGLEADTPLPGQDGWSVIFGRQAMFGGPFRHLALLAPGDLLQVTTGQGTFTYKVTGLRLPRDPQPPAPMLGQSRLTLITTGGPGLRGAWAPNQLLYVDASLVGKPASAAAIALPAVPASQLPAHRGAVTTWIPASQLPMQGDTSGLFSLVLWMQLFVLAMLAVAWVGPRWGRWQTWLVAAPALLAVAWIASELALQMLPNLL